MSMTASEMGKKRMAALSPAEKTKMAKAAARKRWGKKK